MLLLPRGMMKVFFSFIFTPEAFAFGVVIFRSTLGRTIG